MACKVHVLGHTRDKCTHVNKYAPIIEYRSAVLDEMDGWKYMFWAILETNAHMLTNMHPSLSTEVPSLMKWMVGVGYP